MMLVTVSQLTRLVDASMYVRPAYPMRLPRKAPFDRTVIELNTGGLVTCTISVALELVTEPKALLMTTVYCPLSLGHAPTIVRLSLVAPTILPSFNRFTPFLRQRWVTATGLVLATVNVTIEPPDAA